MKEQIERKIADCDKFTINMDLETIDFYFENCYHKYSFPMQDTFIFIDDNLYDIEKFTEYVTWKEAIELIKEGLV